IESNGNVLGRGFLAPTNGNVRRFGVEYDGMLTVGGYRTNEVNDFIGLLLSETYKASRDLAYPLIPKNDFKDWMRNQITLLKKMVRINLFILDCLSCVLRCKLI
ncbi:hypothetical protein, partial [Pantoea ananatis]|uniref:hypothetical protein n=1 Tax=Pantoea ananas TaxID=553 RepID=UPI0021F6FCC9